MIVSIPTLLPFYPPDNSLFYHKRDFFLFWPYHFLEVHVFVNKKTLKWLGFQKFNTCFVKEYYSCNIKIRLYLLTVDFTGYCDKLFRVTFYYRAFAETDLL